MGLTTGASLNSPWPGMPGHQRCPPEDAEMACSTGDHNERKTLV